MSKKQRVGLYDLGRVPVTPVENKSGYEDSKTLLARLQQEEHEAQAAAERAAFQKTPLGQSQTLLQQNEKLLQDAFGGPWSRLRDVNPRDLPVDFIGDYTETAADDTPDKDRFVLGEFLDGSSGEGWDFPEDGDGLRPGMLRFFKFFTTLRVHRNVGMTQANLLQALQRFVYGIRAYESNPGELSGAVPMPEWAGEPKPVDQVSQGETEVQRRARIANQIEHGKDIEAKELVGLEFSQDIQRVFYSWVDENMVPVWGIDRDIMTSPRITRFIGQVLDRNPERNPLRPQTWDFVRRAIDYAQLLGSRGRFLTADERTMRALEDTQLTNANFETRQDIVRRLTRFDPSSGGQRAGRPPGVCQQLFTV